MQVFVAFLFGEQAAAWSQDEADAVCGCFVAASWEWRKEISVRGKGSVAAKDAAVRLLVERLLPGAPALWALFGERWAEPRYYSLILQVRARFGTRARYPCEIRAEAASLNFTVTVALPCALPCSVLQPFIISPAINTGDTMCAVALSPPETPLDECMRAYHPFPIFERFVDRPVVLDHAHPPSSSSSSSASSAGVAVPSHCVMFSTDFRGQDHPWPVFGAGPRACAGAHLAAPFLKILTQEFAALPSGKFVPTRGHRYSGRHLDGRASSEGWIAGAVYFMQTITQALCTAAAETWGGKT